MIYDYDYLCLQNEQSVSIASPLTFVQVYGGPDLSSPRLAQLCTTRPPNNPLQVASTGNAVTVRFTSDQVVNGRGFNATWTEVPGG